MSLTIISFQSAYSLLEAKHYQQKPSPSSPFPSTAPFSPFISGAFPCHVLLSSEGKETKSLQSKSFNIGRKWILQAMGYAMHSVKAPQLLDHKHTVSFSDYNRMFHSSFKSLCESTCSYWCLLAVGCLSLWMSPVVSKFQVSFINVAEFLWQLLIRAETHFGIMVASALHVYSSS